MKSHSLLVLLPVFILINASCSGSDDGDEEYADDMPQPDDGFAARAVDIPVISQRYYVSGSARVTVSGMFQVDEEIPINVPASYSDGEMTWLQYGVSGDEKPNALVTVSLDEIGINVGRGRPTATAGADSCTGGMQVTDKLVTGHYQCLDVTSYDPGSGKMATVSIEIEFSAAS
jgi:hypothetical protein